MTSKPPRDLADNGGAIPGTEASPAYSLQRNAASSIPVVSAVPHAGRTYPSSLAAAMRDPARAAQRLEDRLADALGEAVAAATGAALIVAHAPRAMIDLNRAAEDVDWEMVEGGAPAAAADVTPPGRRARSGLGLVPRRLPGLGEVWRRRLSRIELEARIATVHTPYHAALAAELARVRARWGAALLLDLHSMPPLDKAPGRGAEFVIGDRFGATCDGGLTGASFAHLAEGGCRTAHNRPYAGGYTLERHADPRRGVHALQLEVDRRSYLDAELREAGPGFVRTATVIAGLVRRLAAEVALLGSGASAWREAAE